jgi:hypothetical protein
MFLAIGAYLMLLGAQGLAVEKVVLKARDPAAETTDLWGNRQVQPGGAKTLQPPDWVPWTLMSTGAVVCIYSFTLPRWASGK